MKQEETTKDDSGLINSQQEESLVPIPTENKVDNELIFEQGKHNLEGSEETHDFNDSRSCNHYGRRLCA
jgi:hypothetical protein